MTLSEAVLSNDARAVARVLEEQPAARTALNAPLPGGAFGQTALLAAVAHLNREMIDVLLGAGADINQKSHWWAGGFHVLDDAWREPWLPGFLLERGATLGIHHAVRLGMTEDVRRMLDADPALVHARGVDGQLPLHLAQTTAMADLLLARGAEVNARDVDHESTAAQWMIRDRTAVARHLASRGSAVDLLMASAFGDSAAAARLLNAEPDRICMRVSDEWFPKRDPRAGGTIYIWSLGAYKTAHAIAREFGHDALAGVLLDRAPDVMKLVFACDADDEGAVRALLSRRPDLGRDVPAREHRRLPDAAERNATSAVRLYLEAGWPVAATGKHSATALHWAAFHGNAEMCRLLVAHGAPVEAKDHDFGGTPRSWAQHGSLNGWCREKGDYAAATQVLIAAGAS
jgi:ankyrin repeat protein